MPGRDLHAAGERETNVHAIAHFVCRERALDFLDDSSRAAEFRRTTRRAPNAPAGRDVRGA